jgi:hypothetical protein
MSKEGFWNKKERVSRVSKVAVEGAGDEMV